MATNIKGLRSRFVFIVQKLDKIFKGDEERILNWLNIKGKNDSDKTPLELIQEGHSDKVLGFLVEFEKTIKSQKKKRRNRH